MITRDVIPHLPYIQVALGTLPNAFLFLISAWLHECSSIRQEHTQPAFCPTHHMASQTSGNFKSGQQATGHGLWTPAATGRLLWIRFQLTISDLYFHELPQRPSSLQLASHVYNIFLHIEESSGEPQHTLIILKGYHIWEEGCNLAIYVSKALEATYH